MRPTALLLAVLALLCGPAEPLTAQATARIIAIGDIHGSIDGFKSILKVTGLIDGSGKWTGGRTQLHPDRRLHGSRRGHARGARPADGARGPGQGCRRPRLRAARQSRGDEPDRRDARRDAARSSRRSPTPTPRSGAQEAWEDYAKLAAAKKDKGEPVPTVYAQTREAWLTTHPPGFVEYKEAISPEGQVRRVAARQADRHRGRRQHLHARRHPARQRAGEARRPQRRRCATRSSGWISSSTS